MFLILSVPLSVLVGGRGGTSDTQVYYDVFANIGDYDLTNPFLFYKESGMEIGFGWYSFIIGHFTSSPFVLFFIFSFLNFIFIFKTAQLLGVNFFYVFLVYVSSSYFFLQQFMQMRQGLAISIAFYCFVYMLRCKVNFLVLLLLVMSFFLHQSTLFITSFYLFYVFLRRIDFFCLTRHINPIYIVTT
ncbi:EpsG family protein, partial [Aeromonas caviae]|uniref:EpsG family protein n=1 Tax=Aeromonas caviae TaxID=648 RepID=UPI00338FE3F0